jgi:transcriptional regulator with XRE-family HTH domain
MKDKRNNNVREVINTMVNETISFDDISLGMIARIQRALQRLTQQEVASMACVCAGDVELFESNQSLPCVTNLKLLSTYNTIIEANIARTTFAREDRVGSSPRVLLHNLR